MLKDAVAVLDIGSSKVTLLVGEKGINDTFIIHNSCEVSYIGYDGDFFLDSNPIYSNVGIVEAIQNVIETVSRNSSINLEKLFVGVPGKFLKVFTKKHSNSYEKKIKITNKEIERFKTTALQSFKVNEYSIINTQNVYCTLSDGTKIINPLGSKSVNLSGILSFSLCDNRFLNLLNKIFEKCDIKNVVYVPSPLAECLYLFSEDKRKTCNILLDVGYSSSTLSVVHNDGIVFQHTFALGGALISGKIMENYAPEDCSPEKLINLLPVYEEITKKINFGLEGSENYECVFNGEVYRFPARRINAIAKEVFVDIAEEVTKSLEHLTDWLPNGTRVNLTGGGISYLRGTCEKLRSYLSRGVDLIYPNVPMFKEPIESSKLALLNFALNNNRSKK